jgi:hypothetical protein
VSCTNLSALISGRHFPENHRQSSYNIKISPNYNVA